MLLHFIFVYVCACIMRNLGTKLLLFFDICKKDTKNCGSERKFITKEDNNLAERIYQKKRSCLTKVKHDYSSILEENYHFFTGSQVRSMPNLRKILRSTSESITVEWT